MFSFQSYLAITHLNSQLMSRSEMKTGNNLSFQQTANFFLKLGASMTILLVIICSALISSGIGYKDYSQWKLSYFSIEMESSVGGISQIFFDKGQGLQEQDSISLQVERPGFQKYLFPIPESIKLIRFDPMNIASLVSIKNAGIENGTGDKLKVSPLHSFKAVQQIDRFDLNKDVLTIQTIESADDPITVIDNSSFQRKKKYSDRFSRTVWLDCYRKHPIDIRPVPRLENALATEKFAFITTYF